MAAPTSAARHAGEDQRDAQGGARLQRNRYSRSQGLSQGTRSANRHAVPDRPRPLRLRARRPGLVSACVRFRCGTGEATAEHLARPASSNVLKNFAKLARRDPVQKVIVKLGSISIDLDEVPRYAAIHGVEVPLSGTVHAVYANSRAAAHGWLEDESIRATFLPSARTSSTRRTRQPSPDFTLQGTKSEITHITTTTTSRVAPQETSAKRSIRPATIIEQCYSNRQAPGYRVLATGV